MRISTVILSFNSAAVLAATLKSASSISDEIFVVDSGSTDNTLEIARQFGAKIVQHPFENYGAQRNWAIEHLPLAHDWELHLDADERLSDALALEISTLKARPPEGIDGFYIRRLAFFLGRPIRHGGLYPTWHLRLFRRGAGRCEARLYDQHFFIKGRTGRLESDLLDDQRNTLNEWTIRHTRWADAELRETMLGDREGVVGARLSGSPTERKRAYRGFYYRAPELLRPFLLFLYRYVLRLGFLDGKEGLIFFVLQSFWFRFLIDAKMHELRLAAPRPERGTVQDTPRYETQVRSESGTSALTKKKSA